MGSVGAVGGDVCPGAVGVLREVTRMNERKEMAKVLALILLVCADFAGVMHAMALAAW